MIEVKNDLAYFKAIQIMASRGKWFWSDSDDNYDDDENEDNGEDDK